MFIIFFKFNENLCQANYYLFKYFFLRSQNAFENLIYRCDDILNRNEQFIGEKLLVKGAEGKERNKP